VSANLVLVYPAIVGSLEITMNIVFGLLFAAIPLTMLAEHWHWPPIAIMGLACLGIVPVARLMGQATEHLSHQVGSTIGGLLSATFGNACELIIAIVALRAGMIEVVKASITGSILGNILLVMGASMMVGGLKHEVQEFNKMTAITACTFLTIVAFSLLIPSAVLHFSNAPSEHIEQNLALAISAVLAILYMLGLLFSLGTHDHLFKPVAGAQTEDEGDETAHWSRRKSIIVLALATAGVAFLAEYLVGSVEHVAKDLGMTPVFIGVVLLAIIGNAAENSTAIIMARKNKMDLSINIALGSSTQIAMFVTPIIVFTGYFIGQPMDLVFTPAEIIAVIAAVWVGWLTLQDGKSNWLEGTALLALYLILAISFYFIR
jgi:Ca2+:H+ antiporter